MVLVAGENGGSVYRAEDVTEAVDLMRLFPGNFLNAYLGLWTLATSGANGPRDGGVGVSGAHGVTRTSTSQTETRGPARSARAGLSQRNVIKNERAIVMRDRVNRRLRALGREMLAFLDGAPDVGVRSGVRRCTRCRKFGEYDWSFCPFDGAPTEEMV